MRHLILGALLVAPAALNAQSKHDASGVSPAATAQIRQVMSVIGPLSNQDSARAAGFTPALGWIPFMGTHWVNGVRMLEGKSKNLVAPSQLMFSPVEGKQSLVGSAFAYYSARSDSSRPTIFDGDPPWHDHPDLSPPGTNMVMLHVWFVPSPDGPFAGLNPYLPYWAVGLTPPPVERMSDSVVSVRVRKAGLAFHEVADSNGVLPLFGRRPEVREVRVAERERVRSMIPSIEQAAAAKDWKRWDGLIEQAAQSWDTIRAAYLKSVVNPNGNAALTRRLDDLVAHPKAGGHHH